MSLNAMRWVAGGDAPTADTNEFAVLNAMADKARPDGCGTWLSKDTIAAYTHLSQESVRRCLRRMTRRGLIARGDQSLVAGYRADRRPVVYDLLIPYGWFRDIEEVNADRARRNLPALTAQARPPIAPPLPKRSRADKGKPRRPRTGGLADTPCGGTGSTPAAGTTGSVTGDAPGAGGLADTRHGDTGSAPAGPAGGVTGDATPGTRPPGPAAHGGTGSAPANGPSGDADPARTGGLTDTPPPAHGGTGSAVHGGNESTPAGDRAGDGAPAHHPADQAAHGGTHSTPAGPHAAPEPCCGGGPDTGHGGTTSCERGHCKLSTGALQVPQTSPVPVREPVEEAPSARSVADARRASAGSSAYGRASGCAASADAGAPDPSPRPLTDTQQPAPAPQQPDVPAAGARPPADPAPLPAQQRRPGADCAPSVPV
ncbi:hypothetical protein ACFYN3_39495 [Streptomyces lavendulae]|uniref:hypothetical protein n=1 Tax=Streptomyces lavendulae TaxID=1914 RepID=UPI00367CACF1